MVQYVKLPIKTPALVQGSAAVLLIQFPAIAPGKAAANGSSAGA